MSNNSRKFIEQTTKRPQKRQVPYAVIAMVTAVLVLFTGCGQSSQSEGQQQSTQGQQQTEKVPDTLKSLEEAIESIIAALDGPTAGTESQKKNSQGGDKSQQSQTSESSQQSQQGQQGQQSQQSQQGQGQSQGQGQGQGQGQQTQPSQQKAKDLWKEIDTTISNLHYQWNDFEPEAIKKGLSRELTDKFSSNLNALTNEIALKDKNKTLAAANLLYSGIPDFYSLYKTKTSPEIKRMRYYARSAILSAVAGDWTKAASDTANLKASWTLFKNTLEKDQQELSGKLDLSIYELDKVVTAKDLRLTDIKGRVVLTNMAAIEKEMEKKSSGSSGS